MIHGQNENLDLDKSREFTHTYRVTGNSKTDTAYLTPIEDDQLIGTNDDFVYVSLLTLPKMRSTRVPSEALIRNGGPANILIELWSIASNTYEPPFYRKGDWVILDSILFRDRDEEDKKDLVEVFIRQWAYAKEKANPYRHDTWVALCRLIQNSF